MLLNLETLPRPYVPSAVPLFTGRQVEIEEIIKLITGESTRLINVWGSPGFGKTSTVIEVARHLCSDNYPVYFFKLQGITIVDDILSKILGIFKSNLVDHGLKPIDKLVSIFREISCPIFLIFDNIDDILSRESNSGKLRSLFEELLDSNLNINVMFTTRQLLENLSDYVEGFRDFRIRPLHPVLSVELVCQLLPAFSRSVVAKVARICSHVPLAMRLMASFLRNHTEDMANEILDELSLSGDLLGKIGSPYEKNMKKLFEILFEQLTLSDKHALISLTVFSSSKVCKNAAVKVVSGDAGVAEAVRSLKTLVNKSLADEDSSEENYSIHPLIYSFVVEKAKDKHFDNILNSSLIGFCSYYLILFEKINDSFLAGKSIDSPQLQDTMEHLPTAMHQSLTHCFQDLIRILSKCEIFLFLIGFPIASSPDVPQLYHLAIEKCNTQEFDCSKLYVSKYLFNIFPSFFVSNIKADIPKQIRENIMSSDGCAAKLGCYEGISLIVNGERKLGVEEIEKHLDDLDICPDQQLIKCFCLQLLALYYTNLKEYWKSSNLSNKAIEACGNIGNFNLFLISNCEQSSLPGQNECKGEQMILFVNLLFFWSSEFISDETRTHFLNLLQRLEQQLGNRLLDNSHYIFSLVMYCDFILALLSKIAGQEFLLNEKIHFLDKSLKSDLTDGSSLRLSEVGTELPLRLLLCYSIKMAFHDDTAFLKEKSVHNVEIETCRNAVDLSLKLYGKQHVETAFCYLKLGQAEAAAENYIAGLDAFGQVLEILETCDQRSSRSNDLLATVCIEKGIVYMYLHKFELSFELFEQALRIRRNLFDEDTKEMLNVLHCLGSAQLCLKELTSALATYERTLKIAVKLHADKCLSSSAVITSYCEVALVHQSLGNNTESVNVLKTALEMETDCNALASSIFLQLINLDVDENLCMKFINASRLNKEEYKPMLEMMHSQLAAKQLESGKCEDGLASLQKALSIKLDDTLLTHLIFREGTATFYLNVAIILVKIGKPYLAKRVIERTAKIAESLPECKQHLYVFRCYSLKGRIHNEMHEYVAAIKSLSLALLQLPKFSHDVIHKSEEFVCHMELAKAYWFKTSYEKALTSLYDALSIMKDLFPEGSKGEGDLYSFVAAIANRMKNKSLEVNNLRLAYKMYSKILGCNHSLTEQIYIAYVRALINY